MRSAMQGRAFCLSPLPWPLAKVARDCLVVRIGEKSVPANGSAGRYLLYVRVGPGSACTTFLEAPHSAMMSV